MRIAIVTQPLYSNYGGLLQNWALQTILRREYPNADVVTFDQVDSIAPLYLRLASSIKRRLTGGKTVSSRTKFDEFREKYINATAKAQSTKDFIRLDKHFVPDAYVVGSDQVWRPSMVYNLYANFLSFTKCTKKIAYAASFGVDTWEFSSKQTARCRNLVNQFTAVSVREIDGIRLCADYLDYKAQNVLDPTLLLNGEDYSSLIHDTQTNIKEYVFTYILDTDVRKRTIVKNIIGDRIERNAAYDMNGLMPPNRPAVEEWLALIRDSEMVICDSFHGAAFSIIFNKDFYILANPHRGNSRLVSLLSLFGLENRIINSASDVETLLPINWEYVNKRRNELITDSLSFLHSAL